MFQDYPKVNVRIPAHHLAWILDDCFSGQEISTLAEQCGIHSESEELHSLSKTLAAEFFDKAIIEKLVSWSLVKKGGTRSAPGRVHERRRDSALLERPAGATLGRWGIRPNDLGAVD